MPGNLAGRRPTGGPAAADRHGLARSSCVSEAAATAIRGRVQTQTCKPSFGPTSQIWKLTQEIQWALRASFEGICPNRNV